MIAFVKIEDSSVDVNIGYTEIAEKIWGFQYSQTPIFVNHDSYGIDSNNGFFLSFSLFLSDYTKRWIPVEGSWDSTNLMVRQVKKNPDQIVIMTGFEQELLINQKGFYNLVAYIAKHIGGKIMVGENGDWIDLATFSNKYHEIMTTPFAEAVDKSIEYGSQFAPGKEEPGMDRYFY
ncbi:hypothetical protein [Lactiplantibacillus mudanjiangensis]|uniref:Uncharacterized protein n=1 Tax=Lactiplantibacillus mudanjiangensis TaxID=1296538 RepID=A0A660E2V7_9LACO|nr:hypothetical protein [Lactiplantibacillus mudanjiangensis]VDG23736.1 hypothetical protein [Lactobacillus plantarum WCFS1] [Lactiplantibacillus mudanjiangensis]VDG29676.1 hypothetical protein [Lactobacillus plantarum WCFS1] [Lactiplantibacillus mudanjiangensis]VDG33654.1 hypothetical protein [Lactobacillus plantarum WCFS1] [Lactiplantibacillus mudanjiangensis]